MELKLRHYVSGQRYGFVLIVPYGIETLKFFSSINCEKVLIVPYGIETSLCNFSKSLRNVLIVPYGIETNTSLRKR